MVTNQPLYIYVQHITGLVKVFKYLLKYKPVRYDCNYMLQSLAYIEQKLYIVCNQTVPMFNIVTKNMVQNFLQFIINKKRTCESFISSEISDIINGLKVQMKVN